MNSRLLISIAVPVTAFTLTVAISLWQQRAEKPMFTAAQPEWPQRIPASHGRETASLPRADVQMPPAPQAAGLPPVPPPPPPGQGATDPSRTDVPVRLITRGRPDQSGLVATLLNMTSDDLDVRITGVSAKTYMRSVVDVSLHPNERKNLTEAGLELAAGDQVTIQSPPYRDQVVQAR